jgi:GNAT superfamily N-acetyltransferase
MRSPALEAFEVSNVPAKEVERYVNVDYGDRFGLVAETSAGERRAVVGLANYVRIADDKAEMAVVIADRFHGRGIGSILIEHLALNRGWLKRQILKG